jgi:hypothetical protein
MTSFAPARALFDPVEGAPAAVENRRWFWPVLALALACALSGAATAARYDASTKVVAELTEAGELTRTTETQIAEKVQTAERVKLVAGVAKGVFLMPLFVLAIAVALKLAGWLFGTKAPFVQCFTAAAIALMPIALYHAILALCAYRSLGLTEAQAAALVPSSLAAFASTAPPKILRLLGAVDFFNLWSVVLLGFGFSAASGMRRHRAVILAFVLYAMFVGVVQVGLPAMSQGGPGGPR